MGDILIVSEEIPVVIYKVDRQGTFACFRYEDALRLMKLATPPSQVNKPQAS